MLVVPSHNNRVMTLVLSSPEPTPPMTYDRIALMVGKSLAAMTKGYRDVVSLQESQYASKIFKQSNKYASSQDMYKK